MARARTLQVPNRLTTLVLLAGFGGLLWTCSAVVKFKDPPNQCGDGVKDPWEACDGTDFGDADCSDEGFTGGTLFCSVDCQIDYESCTDASCGNNRLDPGEECDGLEMGTETCQSKGFAGGQLQCQDCAYSTEGCTYADCGDGVCEVELGETAVSCEDDCAWQVVSAGSQFTCATRKDASLWCWGANDHGKLGDGTGEDSGWPVKVVGLPNAGRLNAGRDHVCATNQLGFLFCWGQGTLGQLGYGNIFDRVEPEPLSHVVDWIAAGGDASCSLQGDGTISCWGANGVGQLGIGDAYPGACGPVPCADLPEEILSLGSGEAISVAPADDGETHVCALQGGAAWCWGRDNLHQTGRAFSTEDGTTPEPVDGWSSGSPELHQIAAGQGFTCASDNLAIWCWGDNTSGQLGHGLSIPADATWIPQAVMGVSGVVNHLSAGKGHACASNENGLGWCWGSNSSGQLGDGSTNDHPLATLPTGLPGHVENISAGATHTCAVVTIAEPYHIAIYCWGENDRGQLGNGTVVQSLVPVEVIDAPPPSSP